MFDDSPRLNGGGFFGATMRQMPHISNDVSCFTGTCAGLASRSYCVSTGSNRASLGEEQLRTMGCKKAKALYLLISPCQGLTAACIPEAPNETINKQTTLCRGTRSTDAITFALQRRLTL